jgi:hypothetical protein
MAHLRTQASTQNPEARLQWKLNLIRMLYEKGYSRDNILQLFRLIDWMMTLPKELAETFDTEVINYEEQAMPFITGIERRGMLKNQRENVIDVLQTRFGEVPADFIAAINDLDEISVLKELHREAVTINSLEEFEQILQSL